MYKNILIGVMLLLSSIACDNKEDEVSVAFKVYCEMVVNDAKPIALHDPMEPKEVDQYWNEFVALAKTMGVSIYREDDFTTSLLFPTAATEGKSVIIIYNGDRLVQYQQWKKDAEAANEPNHEEQLALARRFGRLLGYNPQGINKLLSQNSDYTNLAQAGVKKQVTHLYYEDIEVAQQFYSNILGLQQIDSFQFMIGTDVYLKLHSTNDVHPTKQLKSTAIALLTDQLPEWYDHIQEEKVPIKYTYKPSDSGPHDGFVAIDPEGYLLEFEQFKQHSENELFMAALAQVSSVETSINELNFYGSITWTYHNDLLLMQDFYENVLGFRLVADQGWTKIYQTSSSGFIGLVDERRGMEDYADEKAVEVEWVVDDFRSIEAYAYGKWNKFDYSKGKFTGPEKYRYVIR